MHSTVYRGASGFDRLAAEWDSLLRRSCADTFFMTHMWQTTWWRHLGEGEVAIVAVRDSDGALIGLAPLFRKPNENAGKLSAVGCVDVSDYLDWIALRGREREVFGAILDALGDALAGEWQELSLCNVPEGSPALKLVPTQAQERGWRTVQGVEDVVPVFDIPEGWAAYEKMLSGKNRRELRRKMRKAGPYSGVDWYVVGPEHDLDQEIDAFIELLVMSHPEKGNFMHERNHAFFHAIGHAAFDVGLLQLAFLTLNNKRVAAYMNFLYGERIMVYNSGLDPAAYRLSPGIVLMAHLIRSAIEEQRFRIFDFLRGDEAYKYALGGQDTFVHRLTISRG
jgi:CelD/BcsL family acetyltransferase involved in cellulose biosynthesis